MSKLIKLFGNVVNLKITNPYPAHCTSLLEVILQVINDITIMISIFRPQIDYLILIQLLIKNAWYDCLVGDPFSR